MPDDYVRIIPTNEPGVFKRADTKAKVKAVVADPTPYTSKAYEGIVLTIRNPQGVDADAYVSDPQDTRSSWNVGAYVLYKIQS